VTDREPAGHGRPRALRSARLADNESVNASRLEIADGEPAIAWEQVKADLGLA